MELLVDGDDTLTGGLGSDTLTGGKGNDVFKYLTTNFGADHITGFDAHAGNNAKDLIDVVGLGIRSFAAVTLTTVGTGTQITFAGFSGSSITLDGIAKSAISATDFRFAP